MRYVAHAMRVRLNGTRSAALVAAAFGLRHWEFEREGARALIPTGSLEMKESLSRGVSSRWRECLVSNGVWHSPVGTWTRELIARRALLECEFDLPEDQLAMAVAGLEAVALEFDGNWDELCLVLPGALDWYELDIAALRALASDLELRLAGRPCA